jgi:PAS domain S-box-containing protein
MALLSMDYFFVGPRNSFGVPKDQIGYYLVFASLAALIWYFSSVRRRIEVELRQARDKLKVEVEERSSLLDLTHDAIFVGDMNSIVTYWNKGSEDFYGWARQDAIGRKTDDLLHTQFPKPVEEIVAELLQNERWEGELKQTSAGGLQVTVASRWSLRRDQQNRPVAIMETSNDITARKRREAEIAALNQELARQVRLLDQTHDSIMFRDPNGRITYWNRGAQELYGWTATEAIGKISHELLRTTFQQAPLTDIDAEMLKTGVWEGELRHFRADGSEVVVASRWSLAYDEKGQPIVMETSNDLTERRRREDEVRQLNQELAMRAAQLDASNKELEAFAYSVSHDLRAPLRHVSGFAELLQKSAAASLNEKSQRYLSMILEATGRMGSLIDDLLAFSRISRAEAHNSTIDLNELVREAVREVEQDAKGRDITWNIEALPSCYGDRSMLRLAFVNLIGNAVKFTRMRPQAEIEIGCINQNGGDPIVFVRDNGVGFDMKYADKLFGVFQRLHPQESFEGTGIGLATVQRIVHRHGGRTWAEGKVDGGATFFFSLPDMKES